MKSFDIIVVGAGPGGYVAAIRAAQRGVAVALVERDELGGACLHRGCIPSKAYLAAAEAVAMARRAASMGVEFPPPRIDFALLVQGKDQKVKKLAGGIVALLNGHRIETIRGEAVVESSNRVRVGEETYEGRFLILATGTEPVRPSFLPFDGKTVLTTDELFRLKDLPKRVVVIGGGVIGCEMACAFQLLGVEVTVIELMPELVPLEGGLASRLMRGILERMGVRVLTKTKVERGGREGGRVKISLEGGEVVEADLCLAAIGRRVGDGSFSRLGVKVDNGFVTVNSRMETSVEGIYAVGDLVGKTMLAHGASVEGICAVENIVGNEMEVDYRSIPRVIYTIPEVAAVGEREADLKRLGKKYRVGRFPYLANGMALLHEETEGSAEITVGEDDEVLGATVVGAHASHLIQEVALVMRNRLKIGALTQTVHAHPTFTEIIHEAAEDCHGVAIHKLRRS